MATPVPVIVLPPNQLPFENNPCNRNALAKKLMKKDCCSVQNPNTGMYCSIPLGIYHSWHENYFFFGHHSGNQDNAPREIWPNTGAMATAQSQAPSYPPYAPGIQSPPAQAPVATVQAPTLCMPEPTKISIDLAAGEDDPIGMTEWDILPDATFEEEKTLPRLEDLDQK